MCFWTAALQHCSLPTLQLVLTALLGGLDAQLLRSVFSIAQAEWLPIQQIEGHFHSWLRDHLLHLSLLEAPHFSTERHGIAVLFYV